VAAAQRNRQLSAILHTSPTSSTTPPTPSTSVIHVAGEVDLGPPRLDPAPPLSGSGGLGTLGMVMVALSCTDHAVAYRAGLVAWWAARANLAAGSTAGSVVATGSRAWMATGNGSRGRGC
jgi:hypothetical protein